MSINFKVIGRKNPRTPQLPAKYYTSFNTKGRREIRYISKEICLIK